MTQEQTNELMKRYLEGETSLEEERQLYRYFREQDDIPQSLLPYRQMMLDLAAAEGTEKEDEPLVAELLRQESRPFGWKRYAAILVGIVLLSGIAYAAFRTHLFTQSWRAEETTAELKDDKIPALVTAAEHKIYDNVRLDSILDEMGHFYHVKVEFIEPGAKEIRLFFRWDRSQKVDDVVDMLNHFQQIRIRREKDKLMVGKN